MKAMEKEEISLLAEAILDINLKHPKATDDHKIEKEKRGSSHWLLPLF
jgi:hypothetical protein